MKKLIKIPIGDPSGDGHRQCDYFIFESNKPINEVREAYFTAKEKYPSLCPEIPCSDYEEHEMTEDYLKAIRAQGFSIPFDREYVDSQTMADLVVWFISLGDPTIKLKSVEPENLDFCGFDKRKRHIGQFGYGLFC